jgi:hypothetical protein
VNEVVPAGEPIAYHSGAVVVREVNPLDANPAEFRGALVRRGENRKSLIDWIREALVDGVDYGKIHTKKKTECRHRGPPACTPELEPYHWSKPTLRKPGAEKICGMLGVNASFPTLQDYEQRALEGLEIRSIIIRCHLLTADDRVVAHGIGARNVEQDYGDLNKALKMACKSAHIDATLRMAGLSEIFTQDLDEIQAEEVAPPPSQSNGSNSRGRQQTQAPRTTSTGGNRCTERQAHLVSVKLDQAGILEKDFLRRFEIDAIADLPFDKVNDALHYIAGAIAGRS